MNLGIERLLADKNLVSELKTKRTGLVSHPASCLIVKTVSGSAQDRDSLLHSLDALMSAGLNVKAAFGPQHGMRGDKQDNMIESEDYIDPYHHIPVHSLYGDYRRPTAEMLADLDVILFDLQDIGCRIYTYLTTLTYFIDACSKLGKTLWVLDRPNPAGRPIDGLSLMTGEESFVGCDTLPTRHGLTLGEFTAWYVCKHRLELDFKVIPLEDYDPLTGPGFGWPLSERPWINPSPNASSVNMARCFPGTVLVEGTELSEGRGTTIPLEVVGAPNLDGAALLEKMSSLAPSWMEGVYIRPCYFEPSFHKHVGSLCGGIQIHTDHKNYRHGIFKPYRLVALLFKSIRLMDKDYALWRHHLYEYEDSRIPIDVINGGSLLREWVDDSEASVADLEKKLDEDESDWVEERKEHLLY